MFSGFKVYRQLDAMDCAPSCLRMILSYYGKNISLESLKKSSQLNKRGVSLLGLAEAAEKYGFHAVSAKLTFDELLEEVPLPCILYWNPSHFVVLTPKSSKKKMIIADPAQGLVTLKRDEFLRYWVTDVNNISSQGIVLILTPTKAFYEVEDEIIKELNWTLLSKYTLRYRKQLLQLILGLIVGSVLQLVFPYLTQSIVDKGINSQNLSFIQIILIAQFVLLFSRNVIDFIRTRILLYVSTHVNFHLISDFLVKLLKLPLHFFETKQNGDILQRFNDHKRIETFITGTAIQTLFSLFSAVVFSIVILSYSAEIFVVFFIFSAAYLGWIFIFLNQRRKLNYKQFSLAGKGNTATIQLINGMKDIKLNNAERLKRWEWEGIQASLFKLNVQGLSLNQYQQAGAFFINEGKNIFITYLTAKSVIDGEITLGALLAIQYMIGQLNGPVEQLINFSQVAQDARISLERLNEIHKLDDEHSKSQEIDRIGDDHCIEIKNLTFTYPGAGNQPVLKGITTKFYGGKVTAIVGMSGCGKTTLIKLIQKFYDDYEGDIIVGEKNLKQINPTYWRGISGSVMQDGWIFSDKIERNIALGDEQINHEKLLNASKIANVEDFVTSLPLGFSTVIGAAGVGLSGGQKQRILIARAVYKDPDFIFLDEATNSLDSKNEKTIMMNLENFFNGKTVIIVAHRLSTVKRADNIIVLQDGEIVEEGNHNTLVDRKGKYFELVKNQLELDG